MTTFDDKVKAIMESGKSEEAAKKIAGSMIKKEKKAKLKKRIAKQLLGVEFGTLGPDGKVTNKGSIDLDKIDSDDPIAYSMGYSEGAQNTKINPKGVETSPGVYDDYAPEYKRGWSEGNLFFKKTLKKTKGKGKFSKVRKADQQDINRVKRWNSRSFNKKKELSGPTEPVFKPTANLRNRLAKIRKADGGIAPNYNNPSKVRKKKTATKAASHTEEDPNRVEQIDKFMKNSPLGEKMIEDAAKDPKRYKDQFKEMRGYATKGIKINPSRRSTGKKIDRKIRQKLTKQKAAGLGALGEGKLNRKTGKPLKLKPRKKTLDDYPTEKAKLAAKSKSGYMGDASVNIPWGDPDLGDEVNITFRDMAQFHRKNMWNQKQGTYPQIWNLGPLTGEGQGAREIFDAAHDVENRFIEEMGEDNYQKNMQNEISHLVKEYGEDPEGDLSFNEELTRTQDNLAGGKDTSVPQSRRNEIKRRQKKEKMARQRKALRSAVNKGVNKVNPIKPTKTYKKPVQGPNPHAETPEGIRKNAEVVGRKNDTYIGKRTAAIGKVPKILDSVGGTIPSGYPFYVTSRDTYMSGWGPAKGKNNRLIFGANDKEQVTNLKRNMRKRGDQDQIKVHNKIPKLDFKRDYVQSKGLGTEFEKSYTKWYEGSKKGFTYLCFLTDCKVFWFCFAV